MLRPSPNHRTLWLHNDGDDDNDDDDDDDIYTIQPQAQIMFDLPKSAKVNRKT